MSNLSLYNITNKFTELMSKAEEGELTEEEYNALGEELAIELQNKSGNITTKFSHLLQKYEKFARSRELSHIAIR